MRVIRSLHVDLLPTVGGYHNTQQVLTVGRRHNPQEWSPAFEAVTTTSKGLQRLHIILGLCTCGPLPSHEDKVTVEMSLLSHILQLGKVDLNFATVVL